MVTLLSATAIHAMDVRVMVDLPMNHIILVATHYQGRPAKNVQKMQQLSLWAVWHGSDDIPILAS